MWTSLFYYSVWCQQVSPQRLNGHPGCAGYRCSIASNVSLSLLAGGKNQGEWEAAGHVRWTQNICLGFAQESCRGFWKDFTLLPRTDMDWHRVLGNDRRWNASEPRRRILDWLKAESQDTFDHSPMDSLVYGCRGYARYTSLAGIWKPCITARLFTWP